MEGTLGVLLAPLDSLLAVGLSARMKEEVFSLFLSNYFRFGSFFYNHKSLQV